MLVLGGPTAPASAAERDLVERLASSDLPGLAVLHPTVEDARAAGPFALLLTPRGLRSVDVVAVETRGPRFGGAGSVAGLLAACSPEAGPVVPVAVVYDTGAMTTGTAPHLSTTPERLGSDLAALEPFPLTVATVKAVLGAVGLPPALIPAETVLREQGFGMAPARNREPRGAGTTATAGGPSDVLGDEPLYVPDSWVAEEGRRRRRAQRPKLLTLLALLLLGVAALGLSRLAGTDEGGTDRPAGPVPTATTSAPAPSSPMGTVTARNVTSPPVPQVD